MGKKKQKRVSSAMIGGVAHYLVMARVVKCDDGTTRLEPVVDDQQYRLSEDVDRNRFVTMYMSKAAIECAGFVVRKR